MKRKILGVIMECNPFHNGHAYFIKRAKELSGADYCIAVMSGDYVQRGLPAFFTKELRTNVLLNNGADLVLELPIAFSTGSAEYFARAGVALLDKLGCVDYLCFGSESGDISAFQKAAALLTDLEQSYVSDSSSESLDSNPKIPEMDSEKPSQNSDIPSSYSEILSQQLKEGKSFPAARYEALASIPECSNLLPLFESPNNILGIEYCQALMLRGSKIQPLTFQREGAGYHDSLSHDDSFASATGLRKAFMESIPASLSDSGVSLKKAPFWNHVPENCRDLYEDALQTGAFADADDFSLLLSRQILFSDAGKLTSFQDVTVDFAEKLSALSTKQTSFMAYCDAMKSKNYTHTRVSRGLLHIVLEITKESVAKQVAMDYVAYARILGFRKDAAELLSCIKKCASIPLLSKLADAKELLTPDGYEQLRQTLTASHLYNAALAHKTGSEMKHEYTKQLIIV